MTSAPSALTFTRSIRSFTTLKLTSASSSEARMSFSASWMFDSRIFPCPESVRTTPESLSVRASSIEPRNLAHERCVCYTRRHGASPPRADDRHDLQRTCAGAVDDAALHRRGRSGRDGDLRQYPGRD